MRNNNRHIIYGKKLKAGALQYTIVFSLLILMILSLFLMYTRINSLEIIQSQKQSQLIENIKSTIIILENNPNMFDTPLHHPQLLENDNYKTRIEISEWGLYDIVKISAGHGESQLSKYFLFTDDIKKNDPLPSLYLSGSKHYLSVGGNTLLGNNTYLPAYGIRKAYVGGIGYERELFVQGKSHKADNALPEFNRLLKEKYKRVKTLANYSSNKIGIENLKTDTVFNSFNTDCLIVLCPTDYRISNHCFSGNIIIVGDHLNIDTSVNINNCIVLANSIIIADRFAGEGQFFAESMIEIGESSDLKIPSILYLNNQNKDDRILVKRNTIMHGNIIVPNFIEEKQESLTIENGSKLVGQIYCNGYSSFEGTLFGSLFTNGFIKRDRKGLYENYLVNVCIDIDRLPKEYSGVSLLNNPKGKICSEEVY